MALLSTLAELNLNVTPGPKRLILLAFLVHLLLVKYEDVSSGSVLRRLWTSDREHLRDVVNGLVNLDLLLALVQDIIIRLDRGVGDEAPLPPLLVVLSLLLLRVAEEVDAVLDLSRGLLGLSSALV